MSDVLVIQNSHIEEPGILGELLQSDGFKIQKVFAMQQRLPQDNHSTLLVLGGPQSANDELSYLMNQQEIIRKYVNENIPVLGICLGSQLIAKTFGAKVYRGPRKEIGFYHDLEVDSNSSKLFLGFDNPFTVFHWHGDTFDLPAKAVRLVHSTNYPNQAFQLGSAVGIQFHLEVDEQMVELWLNKTQEKFGNIPHINPNRILQDMDKNIMRVKNNMKIFYNNFKSIFNL